MNLICLGLALIGLLTILGAILFPEEKPKAKSAPITSWLSDLPNEAQRFKGEELPVVGLVHDNFALTGEGAEKVKKQVADIKAGKLPEKSGKA